jgi:membrane fusion protein, heavy metal efflux system
MSSVARFLRWCASGIPAFLLVGALAALAWWGHHSGWNVPSFSALVGVDVGEKDDWCEAHGVPDSLCVECNPGLFARPKSFPFCQVHGVHQCPFEHPEIAQLADEPKVTQADLDRAQRGLAFKIRPENNPNCNKLGRLLQFASAEVLDKMGVEVMPVIQKEVVETVAASGEFTFQQPLVTPLYTLVSGRIWQVTPLGFLGKSVKKGDVLALVDAAEVGKAKAEYLQAFAQLDLRKGSFARLKELQHDGAASESSFRKAETDLREANIRFLAAQQALINLGLPIGGDDSTSLTPEILASQIHSLGLPQEIAAKLDPVTTTANLLPVRATRNGTVIEVKITEGEVVDPSKTLFVVADTTRMSLLLTLRPEDAKYVQLRDAQANLPGNKVAFKPDGGGPAATGELVWQSKVIDEKTRTLQLRADISNPPLGLSAHSFGKAQIVVREEPNAMVVPREAIHWEGDCHVVFVRDKNWFEDGSPKVFHIRTVRPGVTNGDFTEVIAGLLPGEIVASKNSTVLRSEMLKNSLGAS